MKPSLFSRTYNRLGKTTWGLKCSLCCLVWLIGQLVQAQHKTDLPATYSEVCFYMIDKVAFEDFLALSQSIEQEDYREVYGVIRKMRASLKGFEPSQHSRAYELWYSGNYTDFKEQVEVAKNSTLAMLSNYEKRLKYRAALYYEHRQFLDAYMAFHTEVFYPDYWFMSQERYFARAAVDRIKEMNPEEGANLFEYSEYYRPFQVLNELAFREDAATKDYLDVDAITADTGSYIPYSYMVLPQPTASYVLQQFILDDATQELDLDRQVRALKRFLNYAKRNKIYFVARFNHLEIRRLKQVKLQNSKKSNTNSPPASVGKTE